MVDELLEADQEERSLAEGPPGPAGPRVRVLLAAHVLVALAAVAEATSMPRGPTSTPESMTTLAVGLVLGLVAGWLVRSRWAMLTAPLVYVAVFEIARLGVDGPTVDGVQLSWYGVIALDTGRLFHGLVAVVPLVWGAAAGAAWRRRGTPERSGLRTRAGVGRWTRRTVLASTGAGLLALAVLLARPASTDAITDADGEPLPGSVAELTEVEVAGHDLGLMIRGHDRTAPVLLFLAGGPGGSELGSMRRHLPRLEEHFVVVTWDQRGTGRSYGELDPTDTLTLDRSVDDTLAITDHLRDRFDQERVYLVGQSWGSTLGVLAAQAAPQKYAAFVGVGQMVSQLATDRIFYDDTLDWARETGRTDLEAELLRIGPPPYADPRNSLTEQVRVLAGTLDTFATVYPQLQDVDFRSSATDFEIPMFFVQGAHEAPGRAEIFDDWYPDVRAPVKDRTVLATSGHRPMFEQPDEFVDYLIDVVVPRATDVSRP